MAEGNVMTKHRKRRIGIVVSDKAEKTVTVLVERMIMHPLFRKEVRRRKKFMAHDEENKCKMGDRVMIEESRPISKMKKWRVVEILEEAR